MSTSSSILLLKSRRFGDARGWFMETYSEASALAAGIDVRFVQDNQSFSAFEGTIRGLHYQRPPHAQAKLVRCMRGSIMDYVVDIRRGSPTYGQHVAARLTAKGGEQLFVPVGFAHGFVTLEPDVEVAYKAGLAREVFRPQRRRRRPVGRSRGNTFVRISDPGQAPVELAPVDRQTDPRLSRHASPLAGCRRRDRRRTER